MKQPETAHRRKSALTTGALLLGLVGMAAAFRAVPSGDEFGPYHADRAVSLDLYSDQAANHPPYVRSQLAAQHMPASILLGGCSRLPDEGRVDATTLEHFATNSLAHAELHPRNIALPNAADINNPVHCRAADIVLPDQIVAKVIMPTTFEFTRLATAILTRETNFQPSKSLHITLTKSPKSENTYRLLPGQHNTVWEVQDIPFLAHPA